MTLAEFREKWGTQTPTLIIKGLVDTLARGGTLTPYNVETINEFCADLESVKED